MNDDALPPTTRSLSLRWVASVFMLAILLATAFNTAGVAWELLTGLALGAFLSTFAVELGLWIAERNLSRH